MIWSNGGSSATNVCLRDICSKWYFVGFSRRVCTGYSNRLHQIKRKTNFEITWVNGAGAIDGLNNNVTESSCFVVDDGADIRSWFDALVIRIGLVSRVKNEDVCGDKLVPVEFGGVRCFVGLSSVNWRRNWLGPLRFTEFLKTRKKNLDFSK